MKLIQVSFANLVCAEAGPAAVRGVGAVEGKDAKTDQEVLLVAARRSRPATGVASEQGIQIA